LYKYIELVQLRPISLISKSYGAVEPSGLTRIERGSSVDPAAYSYTVFLEKIYRSIRLSDYWISNRYEKANRRGKRYLASVPGA
jgi:hypothetical protein